MKVIPAIDIYDGKCVRLLNGDYDKIKIYNEFGRELDVERSQNTVNAISRRPEVI